MQNLEFYYIAPPFLTRMEETQTVGTAALQDAVLTLRKGVVLRINGKSSNHSTNSQ